MADADQEFLFRLYASTREVKLSRVPWTEEQKTAFLQIQFTAQHRHDALQLPRADRRLIVRDTTPIGRLSVDRGSDALRIIEIALLPPFRGRGIGGQLIRELLEEAARASLPVQLHVEQENPARRLCERLGFRRISEQPFYVRLEWRPGLRTSGE